MSAAASTATPTTEPSRSGRLLDLLRRLIDYGRELATTLHQRAAADPAFTRVFFGTTDLASILARILCGLNRADALEARVRRRASHLDAGPRPAMARSAAKTPAAPPAATGAEARPAGLPTPGQIAAQVRRQPIGAVIADICRDFGITASHPLWRDVQRAILKHGGSLARLAKDIISRPWARPAQPVPAAAPAASPEPDLRSEAPGGTGPP